MNLLLLVAGDTHLSDSDYPDFLSEIDGVPLLERVLGNVRGLSLTSLTVALRLSDIVSSGVDQVARLVFPEAKIVAVHGVTGGAACSALLASGTIDNERPLLILNGNEYIDADLQGFVTSFASRGLDAGVLTFESVHPRYSFVRLDSDGLVVEAAEKRPISRHATAGFYYFAKGSDFVSAAKSMIRKDTRTNGKFYICPTFNELILAGARIGTIEIDSGSYHPMKSEDQLARAQTGTRA